MAVMQWNAQVNPNRPSTADWSMWVDFFGNSVTAGSLFRVEVWAEFVQGEYVQGGYVGSQIIDGSGWYRFSDNSGPVLGEVSNDFADGGFGVFFNGGPQFNPDLPNGACSFRMVRGGSTCYEVPVPEPSAYLLMLTGALGLGVVAWRRRENEAA